MAIIYGIADSERNLLNKLPGEVRNIDDMSRVKKEFEQKLTKEGSGFFAGIRKWNYKRQIKKFEGEKVNILRTGTRGEIKVIEEIAKLDHSHHILCGVRLWLPYYVTYNGKKILGQLKWI